MGSEGGSLDGASLQIDPAEVELDHLLLHSLEAWIDVDENPAVGFVGIVNDEEEHAGAGVGLEQIVFLVASAPADLELLGVETARLAVPIDHVVDFSFVPTKDGDAQWTLADEHLVGDLHHLHHAVPAYYYDVVESRAFLDSLVLLEGIARETVLAIEVEGFIGDDNLGGNDTVEGDKFAVLVAGDFGASLPSLAVLFLELAEVADGILGELGKVFLDFLDLVLDGLDLLVGPKGIVLGDALDSDFKQAEDVVLRDLPPEKLLVGLEALVDGRDDPFPSLFLLDVAVDAFLDEDFLKGGEMPLLVQFAQTDFQFLAEQVTGTFGSGLHEVVD